MGIIQSRVYKEEAVILLHGLFRTKLSMRFIERRLKKDKFTVYNINYPSRAKTVLQLSGYLKNIIENEVITKHRRIHFVTHSLGGIVVRKMLTMKHNTDFRYKIGKLVMLAPPNNGSELAEKLLPGRLRTIIVGPALDDLGNKKYISSALDIPTIPTLIIIGTQNINPINPISWISSFFISSNSDGTLTENETILHGKNIDILRVDANHSSILRNKKAIEETSFFIRKVN